MRFDDLFEGKPGPWDPPTFGYYAIHGYPTVLHDESCAEGLLFGPERQELIAAGDPDEAEAVLRDDQEDVVIEVARHSCLPVPEVLVTV